MEIIYTLEFIIALVITILFIIIFCKIWKMTDHVKEIRDKLCNNDQSQYNSNNIPNQIPIQTAQNAQPANNSVPSNTLKNENALSSATVELEIKKAKLKKDIVELDRIPDCYDWPVLLQFPDDDILKVLLKYYVNIYMAGYHSMNDEKLYNNMFEYVNICNKHLAADTLYNWLPNSATSSNVIQLIRKCNLFYPDIILKYLKGGNLSVIECLGISKDQYTPEDVENMKLISEYLDQLPDTGKIEEVKGKEKYICPNGHENKPDVVFCKKCNKNIKGLDTYDITMIKKFKESVKTIESIMKK